MCTNSSETAAVPAAAVELTDHEYNTSSSRGDAAGIFLLCGPKLPFSLSLVDHSILTAKYTLKIVMY